MRQTDHRNEGRNTTVAPTLTDRKARRVAPEKPTSSAESTKACTVGTTARLCRMRHFVRKRQQTRRTEKEKLALGAFVSSSFRHVCCGDTFLQSYAHTGSSYVALTRMFFMRGCEATKKLLEASLTSPEIRKQTETAGPSTAFILRMRSKKNTVPDSSVIVIGKTRK